MPDLFVERGDDDNLWICSASNRTVTAAVREEAGRWLAAREFDFSDEVGPYRSLQDLLAE